LNSPKKIKKTNQNEIDNLIRNMQCKPEITNKKDRSISAKGNTKTKNENSK